MITEWISGDGDGSWKREVKWNGAGRSPHERGIAADMDSDKGRGGKDGNVFGS